mmetsp:Transcript_19896/g.41192  ORF Transcript_19896/g.41192 Transcript_19896/m.41192 type:complete len:210 (+) Transcript_19896:173-802(+)
MLLWMLLSFPQIGRHVLETGIAQEYSNNVRFSLFSRWFSSWFLCLVFLFLRFVVVLSSPCPCPGPEDLDGGHEVGPGRVAGKDSLVFCQVPGGPYRILVGDGQVTVDEFVFVVETVAIERIVVRTVVVVVVVVVIPAMLGRGARIGSHWCNERQLVSGFHVPAPLDPVVPGTDHPVVVVLAVLAFVVVHVGSIVLPPLLLSLLLFICCC